MIFGIRAKWWAVALVILLLSGCGGSDGASSNTNDNIQSPVATSVVSGISFDNADSDVIAVLLPEEHGDPTVVVMRKPETGRARPLLFVFDDGTVIGADEDEIGRLGELTVGDHRFVYTDYTETTVTMNYYPPEGGVIAYLIDLTDSNDAATEMMGVIGAVQAATEIEGNKTLSEEVDDAIKWFADVRNTQPVLNTVSSIGEELADKVERVWGRANRLIERTVTLAVEVRNKVRCFTETRFECGQRIAEQAPVIVEELPQVDPDGVTTAILDVTEQGVEPNREEWDAAANQGQIPVDVMDSSVSCDDGIFNYMYPACPQYIPPEERGGLAALDMNYETEIDTLLTAALGGTVAAEYMEIASEPSHGTLQLLDPVAGTFTYQPSSGYVGTDSFTYIAIKGTETSSQGTVTINVGQAPESDVGECVRVDTLYRDSKDYEEGCVDAAGKRTGQWIRYVEIDTNVWLETEYTTYVNGQRHGPHEEYSRYDGRLLISANYANDLLDGEYQSYFSDGQITRSGQYEAGLKTGIWKEYTYTYSDEYILFKEDTFVEGKLNGPFVYYHKADGFKFSEGNYEDAQLSGEIRFYDSPNDPEVSPVLVKKVTYEPMYICTYSSDTPPDCRFGYKDIRHGPYWEKTFTETIEGQYADDKQVGIWTYTRGDTGYCYAIDKDRIETAECP